MISARTRACAFLAFMFLANPTRGDLLYFKDGGEAQLPAVVRDDRIHIELSGETYDFLRSDFRKIVPGFDPEAEATERFRKARASGLPERHKAVWWAIENGLIDQATAEIRSLRNEAPDHAPTTRMIAALDLLAQPWADADTAAFGRELGVSMNTTRGPHIVLLHQREEPEAQERVEFLEKVIAGYYLFFAAQGIELKAPARRLVFAWFNDQNDYLAFLRSHDAAVFSTTRGYYHPTWNAVVAYDARGTDRQRLGRETAAARREELRRFQESVSRLPAGARFKLTLTGEPSRVTTKPDALAITGRLERRLRRDELLLDLERRAIDDGTAAHEIIHVLAANTGLLTRHDAFPRWLQEGLAMQFELIRGGRWAGISRAHDQRLPDWRKQQPPPVLDRLIRDVGFSRGYQRDAYAQAWALVYHLRVNRPVEFLRFLDLLRSPDSTLAELPAADRYLAAFRRAFGSELEPLERDWHTFMKTVKTPLNFTPRPHQPKEARIVNQLPLAIDRIRTIVKNETAHIRGVAQLG